MFHHSNKENDAICVIIKTLEHAKNLIFLPKYRSFTHNNFNILDDLDRTSVLVESRKYSLRSLSVYNSQTRYRDIRFVQLVHSCRSKYSGPPGLAEPHGRHTLCNNTPHTNAHKCRLCIHVDEDIIAKAHAYPRTVLERAWCATL